MGVVVGCELVVHAYDLAVVNLCCELNVICYGKGESCVNLNCDCVYYEGIESYTSVDFGCCLSCGCQIDWLMVNVD